MFCARLAWIDRIIAERHRAQIAEAREQAETITQGTRTDLQPVDNINKLKRGGTGESYLLRRLARNHPDILDAYEAGEYPSVRAAAIAAGIIKVKTQEEITLAAFLKCPDKM